MTSKKYNISKEKIQEYLNRGLTYKEIAEEEGTGISYWTVMAITRGYGLRSNARQLQQLSDNVAKKPETKEKIKNSVKKLWDEGIYKDRINGMLGIKGKENANYQTIDLEDLEKENAYNQTKDFREKALFYHSKKCSRCGRDHIKIDIHHIDENHDNNLLSNLEPLCVECHKRFHLRKYKQPYVSVTSTFKFDSAHYIPEHDKKCKFLHGHSYKLEVTVKKRVDPDSNMVIDFGKLKPIVNQKVSDVLDHAYINNFIEFPSSENIAVWIWEQLSVDIKGLEKIRLYETETNYSEITKDDMMEFVNNYQSEVDWIDDERFVNDLEDKEKALNYLKEVNEKSLYGQKDYE